MKRTKLSDRQLPDYSRGEEIMNMVTHIVGGAVGVVALTLCVILPLSTVIPGASSPPLFTAAPWLPCSPFPASTTV